jgi:PTH2 family peptidyl-tRNA hydrolase
MTVKQVIVMRRDLKCRRGKEIAQGSHASNQILVEVAFRGKIPSEELLEWIESGTTKVVVQVDSEEALMQIYHAALDRKLEVNLVTDHGKTEFKGVPTKTCLAIGPHESSKIDEITSYLSLY